MKVYKIRQKYDAKGDPVYRAIGTIDEDRRHLVRWYMAHSQGREHARSTFEIVRYQWNGPKSKKPADYPAAAVGAHDQACVERRLEFLDVLRHRSLR